MLLYIKKKHFIFNDYGGGLIRTFNDYMCIKKLIEVKQIKRSSYIGVGCFYFIFYYI